MTLEMAQRALESLREHTAALASKSAGASTPWTPPPWTAGSSNVRGVGAGCLPNPKAVWTWMATKLPGRKFPQLDIHEHA